MTDLRTAAQQALEALELAYAGTPAITVHGKAITALKAALEQPEQEPVAWMGVSGVGEVIVSKTQMFPFMTTPLFTHPPRREWRSLSEEEINDCWASHDPEVITRAIEAALRSKNHE